MLFCGIFNRVNIIKKLSVSKFVPVQMSNVIDTRNSKENQNFQFIVVNVYNLLISPCPFIST